jgi:hypothetical protein
MVSAPPAALVPAASCRAALAARIEREAPKR